MRFRRLVRAVIACLVLGAVAANGAQAAEWTLGTLENQTISGVRLSKEGVTCKRHFLSTLVFSSTLLGAAVEISPEQVDCLEKQGSLNPALINTVEDKNEKGELTETTAHSEGVFRFTGVKVLKPSKCSVANEELWTEPLTDEVIMDPLLGPVVFDRFFTDKKKEELKEVEVPFVTIEFLGAECSLAGVKVSAKGSVCGESVHTNALATGYESNKTGTLTGIQTLLFGMAQQTTGTSAAKPCKLTLGTAEATFAGAVDNELAGSVTLANKGKPFGAD